MGKSEVRHLGEMGGWAKLSAPISSSVSAKSAPPPPTISRRDASATSGLAHVPEKASDPPHCCATSSAETSTRDRRRQRSGGSSGASCDLAASRIKGERYEKSGLRHMGEMGGWAKLKKKD